MATKAINTILNLKNNFSNTLNQAAQSTQSFRNNMQKTQNQAKTMKSSVVDAFSTIKQSVLRGIGFGAGMEIFDKMKDGIVETVTFGSELQKSLNGVMATSGLTANGLEQMKNVMVDIYNDNFGENFEDIGEALKSVGEQTGYTGDGLKEITENAIALRDTFGYEVNESVRSASMLMKQFGIDGDEAFNLISQGKQSGLDFSGEMLDSINEYSVQFKKLGLNAEDMFNVFSAGSQEGAFNLDKVGDAIKEFSIRAVDGSKTTQDGFAQLGFDTNTLSAKFAQGGDTAKSAFEDVITSLSSMKDPLKQSQVGVELFGTQFEDLGINVIESLGNVDGEISNTYNALSSIKNIKYNDIGNAFQGIKRQLQTSILIPISDAVLPRLNDFANWFKTKMPGVKDTISGVAGDFLNIGGSIFDKVLPSISNLGGSISDLAKTIYDSVVPAFNSVKPDSWNSVGDAIKDIIDRATGVVNFVNDNWPTIEPVVYGIIGAITAWKLAIMGVNTWIGITTFATSAWSTIEMMIWGIQNATTAWEAAQWLLNVAMDANPVGVVCLAIGALILVVYEVVNHFQEFVDWCYKAWDVLTNNPILMFIQTVLAPWLTALEAVVTHWNQITDAIKSAWNWLTDWNNTKAEDKNVTVTKSIKTNQDDFDKNLYGGYGSGNTDSADHNATGTQFWKGGKTTTSEFSDEAIQLPSGSKVFTAKQSEKLLSGAGGRAININLNVQGNVIGNEDFANYVGQHVYNQVTLALTNS